jgi:cell wall-associated NlpC family hydrolase
MAAILIPGAMLAGSTLPSSFDATVGQNPPVFVALPAEHMVSAKIGVLDRSYGGSIALGVPQANNEQAPRVATPSHDAAELALQHVGARYRYGGASPRGFDCSGLTMYVYAQLGVELPHKASAQINERFGQRIAAIEELAPGDLVFFQRTTRARGITHVALYVGDGMMVSANSPKTGVQHVSIHGAYWQSRFAGGLRPYR